jgi:flagellar basal-body rod protein FlgG
MNRGIYVALSGVLAQEKRLDVLTNNLANVNTPGFKKDKALFKVAVPPVDIRSNSFEDKVFVETSGMATDFSPAPVNKTGNSLDIAISGDGFFEVMTPRGPRYTRDGSFRRNDAGELATGDGYQVMGNGGPIKIQGSEIKIDRDGNISVDGASVGRIKIVDFPRPYSLIKEMENLYAMPDSVQAISADAEIKQGYAEGANVGVVREMTAMIDVMRSHESYIKMMQSMDEATGKVINEVGRV